MNLWGGINLIPPFPFLFALNRRDYVATMLAAMIPTTRHLQYAKGYIDLGMINEASDELEAIVWNDRMKPGVLAAGVDLYCAAKNWELMRDIAKHLAETLPDQSDGEVREARDVALRGLGLHPDEAILLFNLPCYSNLIGVSWGQEKRQWGLQDRIDGASFQQLKMST